MLSSYTQIGKIHLHFETIDSTNDYAAEYISKNTPLDGTVISASFQTNGHGQFDRKWHSNSLENLLLSIILTPTHLKVENQFLLSIAISQGIYHYLSEKNIKCQIKWPNDVYIQNQKVGGLLIQNTLTGTYVKTSIVGVGLNLNQTEFGSGLNATSIKLQTNHHFNVTEEMQILFKSIELKYNQLFFADSMEMIKWYESKLYKMNEFVWIMKQNVPHRLKIRGIDHRGRLLATNDHDETLAIANGECLLRYDL